MKLTTVFATSLICLLPAIALAQPPRPTGVRGTVTDSLTATPIEGVQTILRYHHYEGVGSMGNWVVDQVDTTLTDSDGTYSMLNADTCGEGPRGNPPYFTVEFSLSGYNTRTSAHFCISNNDVIVVDFVYPGLGGAVSGTVTDSVTGEPIEQARVIRKTVILATTSYDTVFTGADGAYLFVNVVLDIPRTLIFQKAGYSIVETAPFSVPAGHIITIDQVLVGTGSYVGGVVVDSATGLPIEGATVSITTWMCPVPIMCTDSITSRQTDPNGEFFFANLFLQTSGSAPVSVGKAGYRTYSNFLIAPVGILMEYRIPLLPMSTTVAPPSLAVRQVSRVNVVEFDILGRLVRSDRMGGSVNPPSGVRVVTSRSAHGTSAKVQCRAGF